MSSDEIAFVGECFFKDVDMRLRLKEADTFKEDVSRLVQLFSSHASSADIIYTAFDGDHFHLLQYMRQYVFSKNCIPANPESVLGYKNVVMRHQTKYGVLLDDLAILQNCKELWIFSDFDPEKDNLLDLPEGVLVELAYFLKRHSSPGVFFISVSELIRNGEDAKKKELNLTFETLEKLLLLSEMDEIINIANNNFAIDRRLKNLVFFITDPLDFKYSEWLRDHNSTSQDEIALVPGLATKVTDIGYGMANIGLIVLSWACFLATLSKKRAYYLNSFDSSRSKSVIAEALKKYCILKKGENYMHEKYWSSYNIPKSIQNDKWPITRYESNKLRKSS